MPNAAAEAVHATSPQPTLEVRRVIRAPRQRVFDAWTKADEIKKWHAPGPLSVTQADVDFRVGGAYRIHMTEPDGKEHRAVGVYREIDPPKKVVYTWTWENDGHVKDSVVTLEFLERGDSTEVVLRHDGLPNEKERTDHGHGWSAILDKLAAEYGA
jgi:uncharacterized protein YndB with AHSA1/START domain